MGILKTMNCQWSFRTDHVSSDYALLYVAIIMLSQVKLSRLNNHLERIHGSENQGFDKPVTRHTDEVANETA